MPASNWQVIVVDEEDDSVQLVAKILNYYGATVSVAHNGKQCLNLLESMQPTLIMMDLALPVMDGWETLAAIRQDKENASIPVVAMTAYHSVNLEEDANEAGFDACFPKPLKSYTLVPRLKKVLEPER
jgi:CheY-like chemotaxis protein